MPVLVTVSHRRYSPVMARPAPVEFPGASLGEVCVGVVCDARGVGGVRVLAGVKSHGERHGAHVLATSWGHGAGVVHVRQVVLRVTTNIIISSIIIIISIISMIVIISLIIIIISIS